MSDHAILQLDGVSVRGAAAHVSDLRDVSMVLEPGALVLLEPERHVETVSLYDVASGLIAPDQGTVMFDGVDWRRMSLYRQSAERGRIGRIFAVEGWVSNLNMMENIVLSERHHTARSSHELQQAAQTLRERIGLRDCLSERPHALSRAERRRAQWVRAFIGQPDLLLLNAPLQDVPPDMQAALVELMTEARARGAGVMWKSRDVRDGQGQSGFEDAVMGRLSEGRLLWADADAAERR